MKDWIENDEGLYLCKMIGIFLILKDIYGGKIFGEGWVLFNVKKEKKKKIILIFF